MSETLFDGYEPTPLPPSRDRALSADRRRTERQKEQIRAGIHPLTGRQVHLLGDIYASADDAKNLPYRCGSCIFRQVLRYHDSAFPKCLFPESRGADEVETKGYPRVSHSTASDVRAWWPACRDYSPSDRLSDDAARGIPEVTA